MSRAKSPETRQRRNVSATAATLVDGDGKAKAQNLPKGITQKETRAWWKAIWASPMAEEWLPSDLQPLLRLALLVDDFWRSPDQKLGELIAKLEARFGLTPYDRHRMQWKVEKPSGRSTVPVADPKVDPRSVLRAVK